MQIAEQEILIVAASLVVHCCGIKKKYDVADVQFIAEWSGLRV